MSKTAKAIAKLGASIAKFTERKDKINAEIGALREQRAAQVGSSGACACNAKGQD